MGEEFRVDEVSIYGDKLRFLIPHEWVQGEEEGDHYMYHAPNTRSGWLRVSLITVDKVENLDLKLKESIKDWSTAVVDEETGNVVEVSEKDSKEGGDSIHIYYWYVSNVVPPRIYRRAVFSYTILSEYKECKENLEMVSLLGDLVKRATFVQIPQDRPYA